jgi:hypothetical protein
MQYEIEVQKSKKECVRVVFYGELLRILECRLDDQKIWKSVRKQTRLLAVIRPCSTRNEDATTSVVEYEGYTTPIVTDLQTVQCVIGRVRRGKKWGIIDRSGDLARTQFISTSDLEYNSSDDDNE